MLDQWLKSIFDFVLGPTPVEPSDHFAVVEDKQGRYGVNAVSLHGGLVRFDVQLANLDPASVLARDLSDHGFHFEARLTPICPEIDEYRTFVREHFLLEIGIRQDDKLDRIGVMTRVSVLTTTC